MTDVAAMTDEQLLAAYAMPALVDQESGGRVGVMGPQTRYGRAEGMTQMLPKTAQAMAKKLGVAWRPELMTGKSPEAAEYQQQLGQAYLEEGIAKTGSLDGGLAYYHGGPDPRLWGKKTKAYREAVLTKLGQGGQPEADLSQMSDDELMAMYEQDDAPTRPPPPVPVTVAQLPDMSVRKSFAPPAKGVAVAGKTPTVLEDMESGFKEPFRRFLQSADAHYNNTVDRISRGAPKSLAEAGKGMVGDTLSAVGVAGDALGMLGAPVQALVRPAARQIGRLPLSPYVYDKPGEAPRKLEGDEKQAAIEGMLNNALSGVQAARPRPKAAPAPKALSLDELKAAKSAAYQKVDDMGVSFTAPSGKSLAKDIASTVADQGGAEIYPKAAAMAKRIEKVAQRGDLSLGQLDKLRAQIGEVVIKDEPAIGYAMRDAIDAFIDGAGPQNFASGGPEAAQAIKEARALNTRFKKLETVENAVASADLTAASTYSGGNKNNAVRQKLRPLLDPRSAQRMRNLTPAESKALEKAVRGTPGQNLVRAAGKVLDPRGLIGATAQTMLGLSSGGLSTASIPLGMAATEAGNAMTAKNVADLIKLLASGGAKAARAPAPTPSQIPNVRLLSPSGVVGAGTVVRPLVEIPAPQPKKANAQPAKSKPRK